MFSGNLFVLRYMFEPEPKICRIQEMLIRLAFTFCMLPLLAKSHRLYRIFIGGKNLIQVTLTNRQLFFKWILIPAFIFNIPSIYLQLFTDWDIEWELTPDGLNYSNCEYGSTMGYFYITYGQVGLFMLFEGVIAWKIRHIPQNFNESQWVCNYV